MLVPDLIVHPRSVLDSTLSSFIADPGARAAVDRTIAGQTKNALDGLTGVVVRVKEIQIFDNKRGGFLIFTKDAPADVYPVILITNGSSTDPVKFSTPFMFNGIRDGDKLPIAEPGIAVERNLNDIPPFLDIHVLLMRSLKRQRDFAGAMSQALASDQGKSIVGTLSKLVSDPVGTAAIGIGTALLDLYLHFLNAQDDKQIFYGVGSFERSPDALGVGQLHTFEDKRYARAVVEIAGVRS